MGLALGGITSGPSTKTHSVIKVMKFSLRNNKYIFYCSLYALGNVTASTSREINSFKKLQLDRLLLLNCYLFSVYHPFSSCLYTQYLLRSLLKLPPTNFITVIANHNGLFYPEFKFLFLYQNQSLHFQYLKRRAVTLHQ